jgi:hypothetical protein
MAKKKKTEVKGVRGELERIRRVVIGKKPRKVKGLTKTEIREVLREELRKRRPAEPREIRRAMPQPTRRFNPFEHRSNKEVFGEDDGLTIFDSTKPTARSTGSLFGI